MSDNGYFQNATTKGDDKGQEILHKLFQSRNPMSIHTRIVCRNCKQVLMHCQCDKPSVTEQKAFVETRNPMTATADEFLQSNELILKRGSLTDKVVTITVAKVYSELRHQEKLREAEEVSDEDIWKDAMTNCKHSGVDGNDSGVAFDNYVLGSKAMRSKLSPKIAQLQAEKEVLKEELSGGVHSCHPNCQNPTCIIRRERDQFQAEKDLMWEYFREMAKLAGDRAKFELRLNALKLKLGLASLPEEGKTNEE